MLWEELLKAVKARLYAKMEERTAYTYWRAILLFNFADKPTVDDLLERTQAWKEAGISNSTIAHHYCAVKWIFKNFPREFDSLDVREMLTFMAGITPDEREMHYATREEAEKVIANARPREALAIGMAYYGGLRLGEIVQSRLSHWSIDKTTGKLSLLIPSPPTARTKTGRERRIPVMAQLATLFCTYVHGERHARLVSTGIDTDALLLTYQGTPEGVSKRRLYESIVKECKTNGLDHLHPHAFRHGLATILAKKTNDIKLIQSVLGHKNVSSTMKYIHLAQDEIADSMQSVFS